VIFESIAVTLDVDHPRMMEKPVEDGRGDDRVAEELLPIAEALIRGQDRRAFLVPVRDELEEQIGLPAVDGQIPGLVDDDETGAVIRLALGKGVPGSRGFVSFSRMSLVPAVGAELFRLGILIDILSALPCLLPFPFF